MLVFFQHAPFGCGSVMVWGNIFALMEISMHSLPWRHVTHQQDNMQTYDTVERFHTPLIPRALLLVHSCADFLFEYWHDCVCFIHFTFQFGINDSQEQHQESNVQLTLTVFGEQQWLVIFINLFFKSTSILLFKTMKVVHTQNSAYETNLMNTANMADPWRSRVG